jgi:hypothetical protein
MLWAIICQENTSSQPVSKRVTLIECDGLVNKS